MFFVVSKMKKVKVVLIVFNKESYGNIEKKCDEKRKVV